MTSTSPALPTLLLKGKLTAPDGNKDTQRELNEWVPIEYIVAWFRARVLRQGIGDRVLILKSETASGKSTLLPPEVYRNLVHGRQGTPGIICTQPRVLTTIENVMEIGKHYSHILRLGDNIGWATQHNKFINRNYGLLSATVGTLQQQLKVMTDDELAAKYSVIMIDETHERDLQTDMTLYMLKNLLRRRQSASCPFVVTMSATFDPAQFMRYFGVGRENFIYCTGRTAGFDEMWDWNKGRTVSNYILSAVDVVREILRTGADDAPTMGDILIFLPGGAEMRDVATMLERVNKEMAGGDTDTAAHGVGHSAPVDSHVFTIIQIERESVQTQNIDYRRLMSIPLADQTVTVGNHTYVPRRRIILATNVAETGLTLDNLKYVIDSGINQGIEYNPVLDVRALLKKPAPKSRINQRRGRAGRKFRGVFYPLYPKYIHDRLPDLQLPQILTEDVTTMLLDVIIEQSRAQVRLGQQLAFDPHFDLVDPPSTDSMHRSLRTLYALGMVGIDLLPTPLGELSSRIGIDVRHARAILAAFVWRVSPADIITIMAYLGQKSFVPRDSKSATGRPRWAAIYADGLPGFLRGEGQYYRARMLFCDEFLDGIVLMNAVKSVVHRGSLASISTLADWCKVNELKYSAVMEFIRARDQIIEQCIAQGVDVFKYEQYSLRDATPDTIMDIVTRIKHCIYDGFRMNMIRRKDGIYVANGAEILPPRLLLDNEISRADRAKWGFTATVRPQYMLYDSLSLKLNRKTNVYHIRASHVCVLDGFVAIDPGFVQ